MVRDKYQTTELQLFCKHIVVTGASDGIGKAFANEVVLEIYAIHTLCDFILSVDSMLLAFLFSLQSTNTT